MLNTIRNKIGLSAEKEQWLLSPVNITSNGRIHLGHIGGPLLTTDVLKRFINGCNDEAISVLTTDHHENHVEVKAWKEDRDVTELTNAYHQLIGEDLVSLDIDFDAYVNPNTSQYSAHYNELGKDLMSGIIKEGSYSIVKEKMPVETGNNTWCYGGWVSGTCPSCNQPSGSFFCEDCGDHYEATELLEPISNRTNTPVSWCDNTAVFVELENKYKLTGYWDSINVPSPFLKIGHRYVDKAGAKMRLTVPGNYGVQWRIPDDDSRQTLFSYSSLLYTAHLLTGAVYADISGNDNPFQYGSKTKLYSSFGVDNTVPFLVGVSACALGQSKYRPFDKITINYFLKLEGKKFSTSRGHIIWAGDIAKKTPANTDLVRIYLASLRLHHEESDFILDDFIQYHNAWSVRLSAAIRIPETQISSLPDQDLVIQFTDTATTLKEALHADIPDYLKYIAGMSEWLAMPMGTRDYWWLKMWSWICWPILPKYALSIWTQLGEVNSPNLNNVFSSPEYSSITPINWDSPSVLKLSDLAPCLPATMTAGK